MKLFVNIFLIFIAGSFAVEELDEESVAHLTDDLLHEIEKRLRDDPSMLDALMEKSGGLLDMLGSECTHAVTNNTIIETEKSIENGAIFLLTPDVTSFTDCLNICCDTENCNTAIFKDRDNSFACYLFDCGNPNVCQFTEHQDFYVMSVEQSSEKIAAKHESDLDNLAVEETSTTVSTTTSTLKPTAAPRLPSALYDTCRATEDCAGSGTVCESGYCVCESDYHPQDGICRKRCTRFQFECENKGNPLDYPQCIAIYDRCDNIDHCRDASDEMGCGENDGSASNTNQAMPEPSLQGDETQPFPMENPAKPQQNMNQPQPSPYDQPYGGYPGFQGTPEDKPGYDSAQYSPYDRNNLNPQYQGVPQQEDPAANPPKYGQNLNAGGNVANPNDPYANRYSQNPGMHYGVKQGNVNGYGQENQAANVDPENTNTRLHGGAASAMETDGNQRELQRKRPDLEMPPNQGSSVPNGDNTRQQLQPAQSPQGRTDNRNQAPQDASRNYGYDNPQNAQMGIQKEAGGSWGQNVPNSSGQASRYGNDNIHSRVNAKKYHKIEQPTAPPTSRPVAVNTRATSLAPVEINEKPKNTDQQPERPTNYNPHPGRGPHGGYISEGGEVGIRKQNKNQQQVQSQPAKATDSRMRQDKIQDSQSVYNPYNTERKPSSRQDVYNKNPYQSGGYVDSYRPSYGYKDSSDYGSKYGYNQGYNSIANRGWGNGYPSNIGGFGSFYNYDEPPPSFVNQYDLPNHFYDYYEAQDFEPQAANPAYPPKVQPTPSEPKQEPSSKNQPSASVEESQETNDEDGTEVNSEDTEEPENSSEEESESQDQNETNDVDSSENESLEDNSEEESSENNSQPVQSSDEDEQFEEPDDKPQKPAEQAPNSNNKTAVLTQQEDNIWRGEERIEKIEIARPSNRMAVVALSLGLIITAMMLLFVGCRLRNVRKRLRKGRPMNSNEADYLINGMYL